MRKYERNLRDERRNMAYDRRHGLPTTVEKFEAAEMAAIETMLDPSTARAIQEGDEE